MGLLRWLAAAGLVAVGAFLLHGVGLGLLPASIPSFVSPFMSAGALCLLLAAYIGVISLNLGVRVSGAVDSAPSGSIHSTFAALMPIGVVMVLLAPFIPFPVGCNAGQGCLASPAGTWSTVWPNTLILDLGLILAALGLAERRPDRSPLVGLGMGSIMSGVVLIAFGSSFSYITMCPADGCPPLTGGEWWSLFWPNVVAEFLGAVLIVAGCTAVILAWYRRSRTNAPGLTVPV